LVKQFSLKNGFSTFVEKEKTMKDIITVGANESVIDAIKRNIKSQEVSGFGIPIVVNDPSEMPRPLVEAIIKKMDDDYEINMEKLMPCLDWKKYGPPKKRKNRK
jgi:hypothetical protein